MNCIGEKLPLLKKQTEFTTKFDGKKTTFNAFAWAKWSDLEIVEGKQKLYYASKIGTSTSVFNFYIKCKI